MRSWPTGRPTARLRTSRRSRKCQSSTARTSTNSPKRLRSEISREGGRIGADAKERRDVMTRHRSVIVSVMIAGMAMSGYLLAQTPAPAQAPAEPPAAGRGGGGGGRGGGGGGARQGGFPQY